MKIFFLLITCPILMFGQPLKKTGLAPLPPMGWNSWNTFRCGGLNESLVREIADSMVSNGMRDAGYVYVNLDDCWQIGRDENGNILVDSVKFPSGIKALADYVHGKGLKLGIYSDAGLMTCQKRPGSFGYEELDAKTYAEWEVDYLKYDFCFLPKRLEQEPEESRTSSFLRTYLRGPKHYAAVELYTPMAKALAAQERDIVFSICNWGVEEPWKWAGELGQLWRTTGDIRPYFKGFKLKYIGFFSIMKIVNRAHKQQLHLYAGPGRWNDPDMLEVGNGKLTLDENKAHFSMWAMMAAPLLAGNDLSVMPAEILNILTNKKVIAINQDSLGKQGYKADTYHKVQVWVKPLSDNRMAVCFLNPKKKKKFNYDWQRLKLPSEFHAEELWDGSYVSTTLFLQTEIAKHGVKLYLMEK